MSELGSILGIAWGWRVDIWDRHLRRLPNLPRSPNPAVSLSGKHYKLIDAARARRRTAAAPDPIYR